MSTHGRKIPTQASDVNFFTVGGVSGLLRGRCIPMGQELFGRYRIKTLICKGKMCEVRAAAGKRLPYTRMTVASLTALLLFITMSTACNGTTISNTQTQPTLAPAPSTAQPPSPALVSEGNFTGRTSDNKMTLAVTVKGDRATGYLCDGKKIEAWLEGTATGDQLDLRGRQGAAATGTLNAGTIFGMVTINSEQSPYSAEIAEKPAGLYEGRGNVDGVANRIGWIVLPDGSQLGIRNINGERSPAPRLDTDKLQPEGLSIPVNPVDGDDDVVLGQ